MELSQRVERPHRQVAQDQLELDGSFLGQIVHVLQKSGTDSIDVDVSPSSREEGLRDCQQDALFLVQGQNFLRSVFNRLITVCPVCWLVRDPYQINRPFLRCVDWSGILTRSSFFLELCFELSNMDCSPELTRRSPLYRKLSLHLWYIVLCLLYNFVRAMLIHESATASLSDDILN